MSNPKPCVMHNGQKNVGTKSIFCVDIKEKMMFYFTEEEFTHH